MKMMKGQGAFEYLLLIGGVLFLAVAVIMILRTGVLATGQSTLNQSVTQFNETVTCMIKCPGDICAGKCSGNVFCQFDGTPVTCDGTCVNGVGCSS
jgi:hypothetical protein